YSVFFCFFACFDLVNGSTQIIQSAFKPFTTFVDYFPFSQQTVYFVVGKRTAITFHSRIFKNNFILNGCSAQLFFDACFRITVGITYFEQTFVRVHTYQLISVNSWVSVGACREKCFITHFNNFLFSNSCKICICCLAIHFLGNKTKLLRPASFLNPSNSTDLKFGLCIVSHKPSNSMVLRLRSQFLMTSSALYGFLYLAISVIDI